MNEAVAERSESRLAGAVGALDRAFPLLWIGLYLLLPVSGWASEMFDSWFDQQRDLEALRSLLATGKADAIADSVIGPAYIGAAALVHEVFGLSPQDSLVALTRASYALSVAAGLLLVRVVVGRLTQAPPMISLTSQLGFVALVFAAGTWYWSDVPWSHFFAAFLGVGVFAARFAPARPSVWSAGLAGALLALLAATRSFELLALVLAWGIAAVAFACAAALRSLVERRSGSSSAPPRSSRPPQRSTWRQASATSSSSTEITSIASRATCSVRRLRRPRRSALRRFR